jgi:ribosomal peptide maturation radical SAM protein 1
VAYFNFDFAEKTGLDHYQWVADQFAFVLGGERLFARHCFGDRLPSETDYYREVLLPADPGMAEVDFRALADTARHVEPFLDACLSAVDWSRYDVVGFTASFQQTMPSVCLAERLKRQWPELIIAFGGAACEGPMGPELLRQFPQIDYVFSGEADRTLPALVSSLSSPKNAPGLRSRGAFERETTHQSHESGDEKGEPTASRRCIGWESAPVENLDELPYPDFDDYFARLARSPLLAEIDPLLVFETSRGCWWGKKCHCTFCGLNGDRLGFRSKTPARTIDELRHLADRHGIRRACAADNIFDPRYFRSLLPALARSGLDLSLCFELKTNLSREQVDLLCRAGLSAAQLGIESLSTPALTLMGKGVTAIENVQTLRWLAEAGVTAQWNLLYGFPGEDPGEYARMAALLPSLYHLAPPQTAGRVRADRFSPYFDAPERYGITNLRPHRAFRHVYPFPPDVLGRLAYYFDYDYADGRDLAEYVGPLLDAVAAWQRLAGTVTLRSWDRPDGVLLVIDTRPGAELFQRRLTGIERAVYLFCDAGRTLPEILAHVAATFDPSEANESAIGAMLARWVAARLMVFLDGRYLSLALTTARRVYSDSG